jgi:hypothetical protein
MKKQLFIAASTIALIVTATQVQAQGLEGGSETGNQAAPAADPHRGAGGLDSGRSSGEGLGSSGGLEARQPAEGMNFKDAGRSDSPAANAPTQDKSASEAADEDKDAGTRRATKEDADGPSTKTGAADQDKDGSAEGRGSGEAGTADAKGEKDGGAQLSGEKRTQVQRAFSGHRSGAKVDLDINVGVGVAVPRHVHLVVIPDDILVMAPEWRDYRYIIVGDTICIVDPDTFEIVDVIVLA